MATAYKKIIVLVFFIPLLAFSGCGKKEQANSPTTAKQNNKGGVGILPKEQITGKTALIKTNKGEIKIELYGDRAPRTVSNFVDLANKGFYDGLTFHRVEPSFVIQGGDPEGVGTGGPGYFFEDEPVIGEYVRGTVAMANSGPNTNGSQFFICLDDLRGKLEKKYNLFGKVISGMDTVDKITVGDKMKSISIK
ncbi:MAG TPA: peptidylprolyl isomerase [bacterium]|nr:peptidylprolyl isomerase [bacterium]HOR57069.1 peptidylprolyl isomerase [bacterium]HPL55956.1 peptidylprolyl isomerase [bacterium]